MIHFCESGLSVRACNILDNMGIHSKEEALKAMQEGKFKPNVRPRNYGRKTHNLLREWLGLPVEIRRNRSICPNCGCKL